MQNVDQAVIRQKFDQYKTQVATYINNHDPNATVGQVLGTRKTIIFAPSGLPAAQPYPARPFITARYSEIPDRLRHTYTVSLAEQTPLAIATEAKIINVTLPLSVVTSKPLAISFVPATPADEDLLLSYLKPAADGSLPTELPGYLIYMKAQLTLDGEVIAQGGKFAMGTELILEHNFYDPRRRVAPVSANVIVGEYFAIGVDGGQINPNLLTQTKNQLEQAKTELETIKQQLDANQTPVISDSLTKHTLTGNLLQTGILGYFAINAALDQMDAKSMDVVTNRLPSIGTFSTSLIPQYAFGYIPRNVKLSGLLMDVNRVTTVAVAKDNNLQKSINFFRATGPRESAFEHLVPEQLFSTPTQPAQGISAVKALAIAAGQGQKIYTLTKANAAQLDTLSIGQAAKSEIAAALNANKEVTVHQSPITYAGWTGEGYIIMDPQTGAGAYKISGGANGGSLQKQDNENTPLEIAQSFFDSLADLVAEVPEVLSDVARGAGEAIAKAHSLLSEVKQIVEVAINCDMEATVAFALILVFLSAGFGTLAGVYAKIYPLLGLVIIAAGGLIADQIFEDIRNRRNCGGA